MTIKVPFTDLGAGQKRQQVAILGAITRVLDSGWYIGGPEVAGFERAFAAATGLPFAVGVANGTDAIALALRARGIGRGDVVIVPALSAYPTTVGVFQAGATPSFVDVDSHGLIDVAEAERAITPGVRAIVCVHLYGNCADTTALRGLAQRKGLVLVEDCAQAHGASRDGVAAGAAGEVAAWSFYPTKNLGALGDAGAVTCADQATAERLARLRNYGQQNRYEHLEPGFNSRLDPLQAAILAAKLPSLPAENQRRRDIAARYDRELSSIKGPTPVPVPPHAVPNRHLYPVLLDSADLRARFQKFLSERGIETLIHYPIAMPDQKASDPAWSNGRDFPQARRFSQTVVSLPCNPDLSDEQVEAVAAALHAWSRES
jgi:dTDP-4-amino-4,6-dideoxygalactose transaminase